TNRPSLQKLITDIKESRVNMVVVYKLDRLSRSLVDFVQLLKFFDEHGVAFASITQPIDTSTSTGKLMLHILSSFAEFERELISERTHDKMGAARKRGQWLGGRPPFGYTRDKEGKKLVINKDEAKIVREMFELYLKGNSLLKVASILNEKGYRSRAGKQKDGKPFGGLKFGVTQIQQAIKNVVYIGKVFYAGQVYNGQQEAMIDEETFKNAQQVLKDNRVERKATKNIECSGLLTHILHCKTCGHSMFHTYTLKHKTHKYRYYVCTNAQKRGYNSCPTKSVNAQAIEDTVVECLKMLFAENRKKKEEQNKQEIEALLSPVWDTLYPQEKRRILKALIKEADYDSNSRKLGILLNGSSLRLEFDVDLKQVRPLNKWHKEEEIGKEPKIRRNLILAHQLQRLFDEGKVKSLKQASEWLNMIQVRIDQIMNMLLLSPKIQEEIICADNAALAAIPEYKLRSVCNETDWQQQSQLWRELVKNQA
ncbi:MAG: recombinase family protein, partial [Candidatus Omnitrophota bacterium]